ncbi:MAG: TolC family protein, partial [Saprospiraceae bacterium]
KLSKSLAEFSLLNTYALQHHPIILALKSNIQSAQSSVELAEKDYYPDFTVSAAYGIRQGNNPLSGQSRSDLASVMLSMNLPIFTAQKQDKQLLQRKHEKNQLNYQLENARLKISSLLSSAYDNWHTRQQQLSLYENGLLAQAKQTTASMLAGYRVNKVDFLNLVRSQLSEFNNQIQYWRLYTQIAQLEADLSFALGGKYIDKEFSNVKH